MRGTFSECKRIVAECLLEAFLRPTYTVPTLSYNNNQLGKYPLENTPSPCLLLERTGMGIEFNVQYCLANDTPHKRSCRTVDSAVHSPATHPPPSPLPHPLLLSHTYQTPIRRDLSRSPPPTPKLLILPFILPSIFYSPKFFRSYTLSPANWFNSLTMKELGFVDFSVLSSIP